MKRCPECRKDYLDDSLLYCLDDGAALVQGSVTDEPATAILSGESISDEGPTRQLKSEATSGSRSITFSLPAFLSGQKLPWMVAGVLALAAAAFAYGYFNGSSKKAAKAVRVAFEPPAGFSFNDSQPDVAVISPDGLKVVFSAVGSDGKSMLFVRDLDSQEAKPLPGSVDPLEPFWSPDSKSIAFGSKGKLRRSDVASGGNPQALCDAARLVGGAWNKAGVIVFSPDYGSMFMQVSAEGGEPKPVEMTYQDEVREHRYPEFLPDGRQFLFRRGNRGIWAASLDSPEIRQIAPDVSAPVYTPQGYLIFIRNDALVAQAFDAAKLALSGEPVTLITGQKNNLGRLFSVSDNGILLWQGQWDRDYQLVWFDRSGKQTGTVGQPSKVSVGQHPKISPDGKRVVTRRDNNLWVTDLAQGTDIRVTSAFSQMPLWSPDGSRIVFNGGGKIVSIAGNGLSEPETIMEGANFPITYTPDGRFLIFLRRGVKTQMDMWALPMFGERKEHLLLNSASEELQPQLSPNGRWLAYASDETGEFEIYVQSFSADGKLGADKKRISTTGGWFPLWRRDGTELFFIANDGSMMAASVKTDGPEFERETPKTLFKTRVMTWFHVSREFDVSPDGQQFLIGTLIGDTKSPKPTLILNWPALLKK
jgi:Tol biopolymer transport system component